ncbi:proprotein convertase subtilisin/kexin type 4 [Bombina bombina]|uniref:proprotein convertase subtilisin/kexin type 4 n=1 Tax=Bombina bombina TaxID=8345 RepID=UPI00235AB44E|nr:proprotein convertase subtilisin/kexin type 4 [Bombina bombina]
MILLCNMRTGFVISVTFSIPWTLALNIYTNSWAVQVPGGPDEAERIARKLGFISMGQIIPGSDFYHMQHRGLQKRSLRPHWGRHVRLKKEIKVHWFEQQTLKNRHRRHISVIPTDPWFHKQWYMNNDVNPDLGVLTAWSLGYTGKGVVVTILDDGIEKDHPDLAANYDPLASYDFNSDDPDPQPHYNLADENRHGTRCAGEVSAVASNSVCGAGIAYNSKIGGVRMLDGVITDIIEARSLSLNPQHIDIYSASWGPEDNGRIVDGPGILAMEAFYRGIVNGRGGLGSIFVWASGNGGVHYDDCNCDGYTNSIYTLSVSSTTENGNIPWYSEACASILTTTFSSGLKKERQIVTTDIRYRCTDEHTGTSASAPLAAGIIALALEANPALTWRDLQHIVVRSSSSANLNANDWVVNGVGRKVSHHYGYGLLDAGRLVDLAQKWETTRPQRRCLIKVVNEPQKLFSRLLVRQNVTACASSSQHILSLEHIEVQLSIDYSRRGDLEIALTSPMGTRSVLVALRPYDTSRMGYKNWTFMSTHSWDENPQGTWTLELTNKGNFKNNGFLLSFILMLYGTEENMMARKVQNSVISQCMSRDINGMCQECETPFHAVGHLCLSYCPPKYFKAKRKVAAVEGETNSTHFVHVCALCHPSCYTCWGPSANNCTTCPPFSTYDEKERSCLEPQYPGTELTNASPSLVYRVAAVAAAVIGAPFAIFCIVCALSWLLNRRNMYSSLCPLQVQSSNAEMHNMPQGSADEGANLKPKTYATERVKVLTVISFLRGEPRNWADSFFEQDHPILTSLEDFFKEMAILYQDINTQLTAETKMRSLKQGKKQVEEYLTEFKQYSKDTEWSDIALRNQYRLGLNDALKDELARIELPRSLEGLITLSIQIDRRLRERKSEKQVLKLLQQKDTSIPKLKLTLGQDGLYYHQGRLYVPPSLRDNLLKEHHDSPMAGHLGIHKTYDLLSHSNCPKVDDLTKDLQDLFIELKRHIADAQAHQRRYYNLRRRQPPSYKIGDLVWLSTKNIKLKIPSKKLSAVFIGPYPITKVVNQNAVTLDLPSTFRLHPTFHVSLLKPHCETRQVASQIPPLILQDSDTEYEVDAILDSHKK